MGMLSGSASNRQRCHVYLVPPTLHTSWISARGRYEENFLRVVDGHCAHRRRLGNFGQVIAARCLATLHHIDFDIFAHVVRLRWDRRHCLERNYVQLEAGDVVRDLIEPKQMSL
jgi:hypothetical protein